MHPHRVTFRGHAISRAHATPSLGVAKWGRRVWDALHILALTYPPAPDESMKQSAVLFVEAMVALLPCPQCRAHAEMFMAQTPLQTGDGNSFFNWTVAFHNNVNRRQGKRIMLPVEVRAQLLR